MKNKRTIYIQDNVLETKSEDTFGHQHIADAVLESLEDTKPPYIIGVFGGWGTGKSSLLQMISDQLPKNSYAKVTIDAWRYTASTNLSRSFLVHVANEIAPNLLNELRNKLYTSEQEVIPFNKSMFDEFRNFKWKNIPNILKPFGMFALLVLLLALGVFCWYFVITSAEFGFSEVWNEFNWKNMNEKFFELVFIPALFILVNALRLYVIQRPVTVIHERIDAEELFSGYFDKIVKEAVKKKTRKKLVIFVDNLDRLTGEKMVEALESLKTYISNENSVFIVACDDNVVRDVINHSDRIPKNHENNSINAGEHYLDKFFQQTFRVPEYLTLNLQEYGLQNFSKTMLFEKFSKNNIDSRDLISIIIPSDIASPRKVKRLINEFISLYTIVEKRETKEGGQIRPGLLTENPFFLAKFSTIRAEYYDFYEKLLLNTNLLNEITYALITNASESTITDLIGDKQVSLLKYLKKTQTVTVKDIQPYIWLSQDTLSLDLQIEHYVMLQEGLQNGDIDQIQELIIKVEEISESYQILFFRVAGKILDGRLVGIEQENGGRVLAKLLPKIPKEVQAEIANHLARLIPYWDMSVFPTNDVLHILRWANSANSEQKSNLVNMVIERLNQEDTRQETFEAILNQPNIIRENNAEDNVQKWLDEFLNDITIPTTETKNEPIQNNPNRKFVEWIIDKATDYKDDDLVLSVYYCKSLINYVFTQINLLGSDNSEKEEENVVDIENDQYIHFLQIIKEYMLRGGIADYYWIGIINLISHTKSLNEYSVCSQMIRELESQIPSHLTEELISALLEGTANVAPQKESSDDFVRWLEIELGFIFILQRIQNTEGAVESDNDLGQNFTKILNISRAVDECCRFLSNYVNEFSIDLASPFMYAFIEVLRANIANAGYRGPCIDTLISLDDVLNTSTRSDLMQLINDMFSLNTPESLSYVQEIIQKISKVSTYKEELNYSATNWLNTIQNEPILILKAKLAIIEELRKINVLPASSICTKLIESIPFNGEKDKLILCINYLLTIQTDINDETGINLLKKVTSNISLFSTNKGQTLSLIAKWISSSTQQELKSIFISELKLIFKTDPKTANEILANNNIWETLNDNDAINLLSEIYLFPESEFRKKNAVNAIKRIDGLQRFQIIINTWEKLKEKTEANLFIQDILEEISLEKLLAIRNYAIDQVRENSANATAESYLILLQITTRKDVREIMPIVDLFDTLLNTQRSNVDMALTHIVNCIKPFGITSTHKKVLIDRIKSLQTRFHDDQQLLTQLDKVIKELKLKTWGMLQYWKV